MWKRLSGAGLILFVMICAACSRNKAPALPQPTQLSDRYVESVNTVSGSFSIDAAFNEDKKPSVMTVAHAYARVVSNLDDAKKKDVLVLLVENPLPRSALGAIEDDEVEGTATLFRQMLTNRNVRGLALRLATDRNATKEAPDQIRALFNGEDYDFGNLQLELKSFAVDSIEGQIKSNVSSQPADITFVLKLQPNVWTGGTFYQQPPTNLTPGQASGRFTFNKQVVDLKHAYARLIKLDLFDETQNVFNVWLTEKPVAAEALTDDDNVLQKSTDGVVIAYTSNGILDRWLPNILSGGEFNVLPGVERDYVRYSNAAIEGRLFSAFPIFVEGREHEVNVLFNASMLPSMVSDGPVSAREGGEQLPADGGDPLKAYLAAMERMKGIKNFDEGISTWSSLVTKEVAERLKKDVQSVTPEQRQVIVDAFAPLENPKLTGGLIKDNKATLRFSGTSQGEKAEEVVNMHLEDGAWKIGRREVRVG